ncbi:MAG: glycerophosphodiester phosphodiesterase family protein [Candidatus Helarchaeota archaeon]
MTTEKLDDNKKQYGWLLFFVIVFVNLSVILGLVYGIEPMWGDFNYYLGDMVGNLSINFVFILILLIALPLIYCGILIGYYIFRALKYKRFKPFIANKILSIIIIVFFDLLLAVLIVIFGEDASIITSMVMDWVLPLFMGITVGFILIIPLLYKKFKSFSKSENYTKLKGILILIFIILSYAFVFCLPFIIIPSNITDEIPTKPELIAHRGFSHIAPENTWIAWKLAKENGASGIEIDVQITIDGKLFLMHDDTLKRTTNIDQVFPTRLDENAALFNWSDLSKLNAGSWFVERDPYGAIKKGLVNQTMINYYKYNTTIPLLIDAVNFCKNNNMILDVDFKYPPTTHPYYNQMFNLTLYTINQSGIDLSKVWITSGNITKLNFVRTNYPGMVLALSIDSLNPPTVAELKALGIDMVNTHYSLSDKMLKEYYNAGIKSNIWTVDVPSRFSQLWCSGATYITTNELLKFVELVAPSWHMTFVSYFSIWTTIYVIGLTCSIIYTYYSYRKEYKNN